MIVTPTSRPSDPVTSRQAPSDEHLTELQRLCLSIARLTTLHADGCTDAEVCDVLPLRHPATVVKRMSELRKAGLLVDSGRTRPTRRNRQAVVWIVAPETERPEL